MERPLKGIDVSRWQGTINWPAVKAAGMDFVMIRLGYCSYTGALTQDALFESNARGAQQAGIPMGVYVYSYAKTPEAAGIAAEQTLALAAKYSLEYPVAFDLEDPLNDSFSVEKNTEIAQAFLSAVAQADYCPMLYTYKSFAENRLNMSRLAEYDFWLAHITSATNYAGAYTMWQYSWTGSVDGIDGDVDLNDCYKDYPAYVRANGLNGFPLDTDDSDGSGGEPEAPGGEQQGEAYTVAKNDNLTKIARKFGVSLQALIQANPQIKNPDRIYVGEVIQIPPRPAQ